MDLPCQFGKYELLQRIATGGMAEVYLARSFGVAGFEKRLVIKRIRPELAEDPRFIRMFIHEAKISVHLNHPNVVQVYELGRVSGTHYMAMEHLHGKDLTRLVKTLRAHETKLPLPIACWVVAEALRGLSHAHGQTLETDANVQLVHQDVSPHNILVTFEGDVKVVDFGIARLVNTAEAAQASPEEGSRRPGGGKYAYMSPEQALGQPVDHRTDVFSAGIVFAAPVMIFLMLVSLLMGLLARAVPTLNVLEIGFTMRVIVALGAMFVFTIPLAVGLLYEWMKGGLEW